MVNTTKEVGMGITDKFFSYIKDTFNVSLNSETNQFGFMQSNYSTNLKLNETITDSLDEKQFINKLIESYKYDTDYYQFLSNCKKEILSIHESCDSVSSEALQIVFKKFLTIFDHIQSNFVTLNFEIRKYLLLYMIPVVSEYISNKIAPERLLGLQKMNTYTYLFSGLSQKCMYNVNKSILLSKYAVSYFEKYFASFGQTYEFLPSIFDLVMEDKFKSLEFDEELHHLELNWTLLNESKVLCKLLSYEKLDSDEFQSLITRIKNMVLIGRYPINYYQIIFLYISYFIRKDLISCSDTSVLSAFKSGLTTVSQKVKYDPSFIQSFDLVKEESALYGKFYEYAFGIDRKLMHQKNKELSLNLLRLLPDHTDMFFNFFTSKKNVYHFYPALSYLNSAQVFSKIIYLHKTDLEIFNNAIQKRYLEDVRFSRKNYIEDAEVLLKLKSDISGYLNEKNNRAFASITHLNSIEKVLEEVVRVLGAKEKLSA